MACSTSAVAGRAVVVPTVLAHLVQEAVGVPLRTRDAQRRGAVKVRVEVWVRVWCGLYGERGGRGVPPAMRVE